MSIRQSDFYLVPNLLSLSRVISIPIVIGLLYYEMNIGALITFLLVGVSDYIDGWVARRYKWESKLGMLLDPLADKLIILSIMIMLMWLGRLDPDLHFRGTELIAPILVIVTVGREIGITGLRAIASSVGIVIPAEKGGKIKTTIQFISISFLIFGRPGMLEIGQVLLAISVVTALWSGISYCFKFMKRLPE